MIVVLVEYKDYRHYEIVEDLEMAQFYIDSKSNNTNIVNIILVEGEEKKFENNLQD